MTQVPAGSTSRTRPMVMGPDVEGDAGEDAVVGRLPAGVAALDKLAVS